MDKADRDNKEKMDEQTKKALVAGMEEVAQFVRIVDDLRVLTKDWARTGSGPQKKLKLELVQTKELAVDARLARTNAIVLRVIELLKKEVAI